MRRAESWRFDRNLNLVAEHPAEPPADGFNPHGISVRPELNLWLSSDFICPSTKLNAVPGALDLCGSIRVWDPRRRTILRSIQIPGAGGTIDVRMISGDSKARAYTAGMLADHLYLVDPNAWHGDSGVRFRFDLDRRVTTTDAHDPGRAPSVHYDEPGGARWSCSTPRRRNSRRCYTCWIWARRPVLTI